MKIVSKFRNSHLDITKLVIKQVEAKLGGKVGKF